MPTGFIGPPARRYLTQATQDHTRATNVLTQAPTGQGVPTLRQARNLPFSPEDANTGTTNFGRGGTGNIAVNQQDYETISRQVSQLDDKIGHCIYTATTEIEEICQTIFRLPSATPRCMNISDKVKTSLGQFRSVTEDAGLQIRRFASDITNIG